MAAASDSASSLNLSREVLRDLRRLQVCVRRLPASRLEEAFAMEKASYPEDEAASLDALTLRQQSAGEHFLGAFEQTQSSSTDSPASTTPSPGDAPLVAYICGTLCFGSTLTHDTMATHSPGGRTLCIHSVVTREDRRRGGQATGLMRAYIETMAQMAGLDRILLIAKAPLLGFYAQCGFRLVGLSSVVHGRDPWFEMKMSLHEQPPRALEWMQVDAFAQRAFEGNQAAVFFSHGSGHASAADQSGWMQRVAAEMKLSETAFLQLLVPGLQEDDEELAKHSSSSSSGGGGGDSSSSQSYRLRWFTPAAEVDLCGHATLAAAHALWTSGRVGSAQSIRFHTLSGVLTCRRRRRRRRRRRAEEEGGEEKEEEEGEAEQEEEEEEEEEGKEGEKGVWWIELDFPAEEVGEALPSGHEDVETVALGLGLQAQDILFAGRNRLDMLVHVSRDSFMRGLKPSFGVLGKVVSRGIVVTCEGGGSGAGAEEAGGAYSGSSRGTGADFLSRCFFPRFGIDEDPVTGSAHCGLCPYWAAKLGRTSLVGFQASASGGFVLTELRKAEGRVTLSGQAATTSQGLWVGGAALPGGGGGQAGPNA